MPDSSSYKPGDKVFKTVLNGSNRSFDNASLLTGIDSVIEVAKHSQTINDAYGNRLTATGTDDKVKSFETYGLDNSTLNWPLWLALYNDSWVFRRAIDKPAQDEISCGIKLLGNRNYARVYADYERYKTDLIQLLQWGALFGGSVAVMMFDGMNDDDMSKPLNLRLIQNRRMKLYVTDRWYGVSQSDELVDNMRDMDFGLPKYYNISFANGHMCNVHHSFVLRYEHRAAPKLIKCGQLQGWGYAEGSHILNELSRDDQLKSAITSLVNKSLIEVVKMSGMRGVFMGADKGNEEQLTKRLEMVNWARNFNSLTFLDKDDEYQMNSLDNISGLSNLLETNMWLVSAALDMQGILFGELKGGLSQDTEALQKYSDTIKLRCETFVRPILQKLLTVIFAIDGVQEHVDFKFQPFNLADVNDRKLSGMSNFAAILTQLSDAGVISKFQCAQSFSNYLKTGEVNIEFGDIQLSKLQYEEETEILLAYKTAGKAAPESILENQFPEHESGFHGRFNPTGNIDYKPLQTENSQNNQSQFEEPTPAEPAQQEEPVTE